MKLITKNYNFLTVDLAREIKKGLKLKSLRSKRRLFKRKTWFNKFGLDSVSIHIQMDAIYSKFA